MDAYWRAVNCLSVGQLYLYDNPLLKKPLEPLVVGHWVRHQARISFMFT
jgi:xylulose-5-phosphate/fructose-6-phosphate phosphoketolase